MKRDFKEDHKKFMAAKKLSDSVINDNSEYVPMKTNEKMTDIPIGLVPKLTIDKSRLHAIKQAIGRYTEAELNIPIDWIREYNELIGSTKKVR